MKENNKKENIWLKVNNFISDYKAILLVGFTILTAIIGWKFYGVSIGHEFKEIASKQEEYRRKETEEKYKREMINNHIALGNEFLNLAQNVAAKIEFEKALKLDEYCAEAEMGLFKAGIFDTIASKGYDPEILLKRIQVLMKLDTAHAHAYVYMGDVYSYINQERALAYYDTAIGKDSTMAAAFFGKGVIYDQQGNKNGMAEVMYKKALDISPWNRIFIGNLAYQYYRNQDYNEAIRYCDSLEHLDPNYIVSYYTMASSYLCIGNLNASISCNDWLLDLLNNNKVVSQEMNIGAWFFIEGKDSTSIYFYNNNAKKYYALYGAALAYHLAEDYKTSAKYRNLAEELELYWYDKQQINKLITWDVDNLAVVQSKYTLGCSQFKQLTNL